jgi:hypothetical protein
VDKSEPKESSQTDTPPVDAPSDSDNKKAAGDTNGFFDSISNSTQGNRTQGF